MKVWALVDHSWDSDTLIGVYSSKELAELARDRLGGEVDEIEMDEHAEELRRGAWLYLVRTHPNGTCVVEHTTLDGTVDLDFDMAGRMLSHVWAVNEIEAVAKTRDEFNRVTARGLWPYPAKVVDERIANSDSGTLFMIDHMLHVKSDALLAARDGARDAANSHISLFKPKEE